MLQSYRLGVNTINDAPLMFPTEGNPIGLGSHPMSNNLYRKVTEL